MSRARVAARSGADGHYRLAKKNSDLVTLAAGLCFDSLLFTSREDQETALRTRLLECDSHELVDQFAQNDLAGDGLRHLNHRREIKMFDGGAKRRGRAGRWVFLPK